MQQGWFTGTLPCYRHLACGERGVTQCPEWTPAPACRPPKPQGEYPKSALPTFPTPHSLLLKVCQAVGEGDPTTNAQLCSFSLTLSFGPWEGGLPVCASLWRAFGAGIPSARPVRAATQGVFSIQPRAHGSPLRPHLCANAAFRGIKLRFRTPAL